MEGVFNHTTPAKGTFYYVLDEETCFKRTLSVVPGRRAKSLRVWTSYMRTLLLKMGGCSIAIGFP